MISQEELYKKALAYTADSKTAREIAVAAADKEDPRRFVTEEAIRLLKEQKPDLFTGDVQYRKGETEYTAKDPVKDTEGLEPEERIPVLLAAYEEMNDEEIAAYLSLAPDYVRGLRQSAYERKKPKKNHLPVPVEKRNAGLPIEQKKRTKKIPVWGQIAISLVLAALLGGFFGVRSYASSQYQRGITLMNERKFAEAAAALESARRFGCKEDDLYLRMGEAYYHNGQPEEALTWLEKHFASDTALNEIQLECYETVWKQSLENGDYARAADMMRREYQYSRSPYALFRQMAAENGSTFTDEKGNVFNLYGMPEKVVVCDPSGTEIYTADLKYENSTKLISVGKMTNIPQKQPAEYRFTVHPGYTESTITELDTHNSPLKRTVVTKDGKEETVFDNTYEKGLLKKVTYKQGDTEYTDEYVYDGNVLEYIRHNDSVISYGYDSEGRLTKEITKQGVNETEMIRYEYDHNGRMTKKSVYSTGISETYGYAPDGIPFTSQVYESDGTVSQTGYYIRGYGWVYFSYED